MTPPYDPKSVEVALGQIHTELEYIKAGQAALVTQIERLSLSTDKAVDAVSEEDASRVKRLEDELRGNYVRNERFAPIEKLTWTVVLLILSIVIGWGMSLVGKQAQQPSVQQQPAPPTGKTP